MKVFFCRHLKDKSCRTCESEVEYEGPHLDTRWNVGSVDLCASECAAEPECKLWTYVEMTSAGFLKTLRIRDVISLEASSSGECITKTIGQSPKSVGDQALAGSRFSIPGFSGTGSTLIKSEKYFCQFWAKEFSKGSKTQ